MADTVTAAEPSRKTSIYPKGDLRRMLAVLAAIDRHGGASLVQIVAMTGLDKKTVTQLIKTAGVQAGVIIEKKLFRYRIVDWGSVIRQKGAAQTLTQPTAKQATFK